MIFDGLSEAGETSERDARSGRPAAFDVSIDEFWQDRKQKRQQKDFADCYRTYRLTINENFFSIDPTALLSEPKVMTRRQRKISKRTLGNLKLPPYHPHRMPFKQLQPEPKSLFALPPSETIEEIEKGPSERFAISIHNIDQFDSVAKERKTRSLHSRVNLNRILSTCSFKDLKSLRTSSNLPRRQTIIDLPERLEKDKENAFSIKSLESLDVPPPKKSPSNPKVQDEKCPICERKFVLKDEVAITNFCNHAFHEKCLKAAVQRNWNPDDVRCPQCQASL